ncbi:TBC domain-containing protein kinase-like protein isoform X2 [Neodiprion virginianus]|uniref:TBC domain-containing protein kinase-like protein isoform X2 n=1 Tax=Neodiprion virginianus TaxID=2961670 RepID=UPI001EE71A6F|nr:TBC domain-containing protein kinase-like protein isoform X2 [Neodiprion virginianus]
MCPALLEDDERCLGGTTFFARSHPVELCGSNGLPLTPNSITIYGRSQFLKTIEHSNLSTYLDIIRSKHERIVVVAEYSGEPLSNRNNLSLETVKKILYQCLLGLCHINKLGLVHRHLSPDNILITKDENVKLYNYGLYYMTDSGRNVSFPIGLVVLLGQIFGRRDMAGLLDLRVVKVPLDTLRQRLCHIPFTANYPRLMNGAHIQAQDNLTRAASQLPLIIRERDTEYQFYRIVLYERLLQGYPITRDAIIREAHKDIPPLVRGRVWAALLNVSGDIERRYQMIDKETPTHTDRQIEVDIPRCHQYSELLSSGAGHQRLQRLLKAWVRDNPNYVYWQGLDSLTAPFLFLNFDNEARAFACISAFIPKYLHKFFLKDNSAVIQEYLGKFSQTIAFHDPQLANHLKSINFVPELFAIPWFLTMFSHVFPLHKILHLWDKLLLGDSSFPLLVGLAILRQLRDSLLTSGFNECILLFSDLPEIDIELCVKDSMAMYYKTPASITYRSHQLDQSKATNWIDPEPGTEKMPRISIKDFMNLLQNSKQNVIVVDLRNNIQFERGAVLGSINIPFTSVQLSHTDIMSLGPHAEPLANNRDSIVVIIGQHDQNNALFTEFLISCRVLRVCSLEGGIYALRSTAPHILVPPR